MNNWTTIPSEDIINQTAQALTQKGFNVIIAENREDAKTKAFELIPQGSETMTMTSVTLDSLGISGEINSSEKYNSVRKKLMSMDRATQSLEMQKLGAAPEYTLGSVHALTQDGHVLIASRTGSQLPAYVYGAAHVVWVVGAQKIVANVAEGMKRIEEYTLPLESDRAHKAYGVPGSQIDRLLIFYQEETPNRINIILLKENIGF